MCFSKIVHVIEHLEDQTTEATDCQRHGRVKRRMFIVFDIK